jgi:NADH-quinone oxidoreductase subunit G
LRRIENRYNGSVNHYFLCDRGRFGYGYVNQKDRPRQPLAAARQRLTLNAEQAMQGRGHPASGEEHHRYRLAPRQSRKQLRTARTGRCREFLHRYHRRNWASPDAASAAKQRRATPALREIEGYDAVLVLGEDLTQTGARIALSVRQSVKGKARSHGCSPARSADWQIAAIKTLVSTQATHCSSPTWINQAGRHRCEECVHARG